MKEIILCKYGEIVLKGLNRGFFENMLISDLKKRVAPYGNFSVTHAQSTAYIEPLDDEADIDGAIETAKKVFGFVSIIRAAVAKKELEDIMRVAADYIPQFLAGARSFRAEAKRAAGQYAYEFKAAENHLSREQTEDWLYQNMGPRSLYAFLHGHEE